MFALVSCASQPKGAEVVVSHFLDKVKALEISKESLSPYIYDYSDQLETFDRMANSPGFSESKNFFNIYFGHLSYKFKEQKSSPDGTFIVTEVRNYSLASMEKLNNANEDEKEKIMKDSENYLNDLLKKFKIKDSDFLTNEVTFLVKKDEKGVDKIVLKDQEQGDKLISALMPRPDEQLEGTEIVVEGQSKDGSQQVEEVILESTASASNEKSDKQPQEKKK
ncbi:UNVERIFIED_CONTAM: hypothetical protein PYX00_010954 [Menopon gallinae]|uniref:Uncharacterized protein n=1 Tax=Menopon gallinae TaxID=328185 RepID=A0AAW2H6Q6_9NEOP